ncbi:MAG: hypothetical protein ACKVXR_06940 [Planctomycetota bacterium]
MNGLEWTRPLGLLALALPIAVLLASRLLARPSEIATGTLEVWKRVLAAQPRASPRSRRRIPPAVWMLAAGLALGALALAGPRKPSSAARELRVLVDRSPSMELPLGAGTRRDRATELARKWIDENLPRGSRVEWLEQRGAFGPEDDRPDTLWVTDAAPQPPPERAGLVASGGGTVPGAIAVDGTTRFDWDGDRIVEVPMGAPKRRVLVSGELPVPIAGVLAAWADARGAIMGTGDDPGASLVLRTGVSGPSRDVEVGRDGWKAGATAAGAPPPLPTWLEDREQRALVCFEPGRIESALVSMSDPEGDPAAFAVSWARLFDDAVLAPPGVVELGERRAAGDERILTGIGGSAEETDRGAGSFATWLALASAGFAAIAAGLARSGKMG